MRSIDWRTSRTPMTGRTTTPEQRAEIVAAYAETSSIEALARQFGRSPRFIRKTLLDEGVQLRYKRKAKSE